MVTAQKTSDPIPSLAELEKIYSAQRLFKEGQRWDGLRTRFEHEFGQAPQFIARAPGRVNLMGE